MLVTLKLNSKTKVLDKRSLTIETVSMLAKGVWSAAMQLKLNFTGFLLYQSINRGVNKLNLI